MKSMKSHTSFRNAGLTASILFALLLLAGCTWGDDDNTSTASCGEGEAVGEACVYQSALIIEGFDCPQGLDYRSDFAGFAMCTDGPPDDDLLSQLDDQGFEPDPWDADTNMACDRPGGVAREGCNSCVCERDGSWSCTDAACVAEPGGACENEGERVAAADGCNTCECDGGTYACTEMACGQDAVSPGDACRVDGETAPAIDGCNTCTCARGSYACTEIACTPESASCESAFDVRTCSGLGCFTAECPDDATCPGTVICTEEPATGDSCWVPGSYVDLACGRCECSDDGQWECGGRCR